MAKPKKLRCTVFGPAVFDGPPAYGVMEGSCILYEAQFTKATAERIAVLESGRYAKRDWERLRTILVNERFDVNHPESVLAQCLVREEPKA